ncbi:hypothetical protein MSG28_013150 [Choristoneura fumiferana]|uniref:Uncharacterized protein n=1 Tax=Choristoneura fumiferana TaxID=7141 RepID=A0ACC0KS28_CHOFU|nr:hypothetical protein MSG28_013150 [Choristoneura fumiferana]
MPTWYQQRLFSEYTERGNIKKNKNHYIQNVLENESARDRLKGWGLSIAPETVNLVARTLPPETLYFGKNATVVGKPNADWNGDVTRNAVMQAVDIIRWTIIYTKRDEQVTKVINARTVMNAQKVRSVTQKILLQINCKLGGTLWNISIPYDFLIVSQKVNQGTVTPTHYVVVHDDSGMTPDQCQRLTYKMCHLYYNWPGTVRVPAPCQYAHKLAYLVGQNIHQQPSEALSDKLFFL